MKTDISLKICNFTSNNYLKNVSCDRHQHCQSLTVFLTLVMLFNDQQISMFDLVRCRLQMYIISENIRDIDDTSSFKPIPSKSGQLILKPVMFRCVSSSVLTLRNEITVTLKRFLQRKCSIAINYGQVLALVLPQKIIGLNLGCLRSGSSFHNKYKCR